MKKGIIFVGCLLYALIAVVSMGYAQDTLLSDDSISADAASVKKEIEIVYPEKSKVVSGYFLPVSWKDSEVESLKLSYPENYENSGKTYQVTVYDKKRNVLLEEMVSNQNYIVFNYDDIEGVLERDIYFVAVEDASSFKPGRPINFFYEKPLGEITDVPPADVPVESSDTASEKRSVSAATSDCEYCRTQGWPGMLVIMVNATTYEKYINIFCNQITWYSRTLDPGFSGPIFVSISSGNFKISYYDSFIYTFQCPQINPFVYTVVRFP